MANTYSDSQGNRVKKSAIDRKVTNAKVIAREEFIDRNGYLFCIRCGMSGLRIDNSHIVSVKEAQESGRCEIAYDPDDIEQLCQDKCHKKDIEQWSHHKRDSWYKFRKSYMEQVKAMGIKEQEIYKLWEGSY